MGPGQARPRRVQSSAASRVREGLSKCTGSEHLGAVGGGDPAEKGSQRPGRRRVARKNWGHRGPHTAGEHQEGGTGVTSAPRRTWQHAVGQAAGDS